MLQGSATKPVSETSRFIFEADPLDSDVLGRCIVDFPWMTAPEDFYGAVGVVDSSGFVRARVCNVLTRDKI